MSSTQQVAMVGASGMGREALDVLEAMMATGADIEVIGVVDDGPSRINLERLAKRGIRHLGTVDHFIGTYDRSVSYVLGIGSPTIRRRLVEQLDRAGFTAFQAIHPRSFIGTQATFGAGVIICAGASISTNVVLGRHVHINPNVTIGHDCTLGDYVSMNQSAVISGEVTIGEGSLIGSSATILQCRTVGSAVLVGAAALVTKDVPAGVVVMGVPGRWGADASHL